MTTGLEEGWITTDEAVELTFYSAGTIRRLARNGKVKAHKVGRDWVINRKALLAYADEMKALGEHRYSPRRNPDWEQSHQDSLERRWHGDEGGAE